MLFWDFDGVAVAKVITALRQIQFKYDLSHIYIIRSRNGFNAFCLDKVDIFTAYEVKANTRYDDFFHQIYGMNLGGWCLRIGADKSFFKLLSSRCFNVGSYAHKVLFEKLFNIVCEGLFDDNKLICFNNYGLKR